VSQDLIEQFSFQVTFFANQRDAARPFRRRIENQEIACYCDEVWVMAFWLIKSEPDVYGIEDMRRENIGVWDGVRNYQARNYLKAMKAGDMAFFYHSNAKPPGIIGLVRVVTENIPDPTQFDPSSEYYDAKSSIDNPRWHTVRVQFVEALAEIIALDTLRDRFEPEELGVVRRGTRLSVIPVEDAVAQRILQLGQFQWGYN
jgi:predicted RNA-binding protein with PUA-like domain